MTLSERRGKKNIQRNNSLKQVLDETQPASTGTNTNKSTILL
jgi:hypothetical protein